MNPKTQIFFLLFIIAILTVIVGVKSCDKPYNLSPETTKLINKANTQEAKIKAKEAKASILHDTIAKIVTRYRTIRHDSLIPCETKLVICDTIIVKDSTLIAAQDSIITDLHSLVGTWKEVHSSDSTDLVKANKEVKKQKRRVVFWKVVSAVEVGVIGFGAVKN
jgi:hypothetical protein